MKKVVLIDPDKDPRWDEFVTAHSYGLITQLSGWKKVLEKSFNQIRGHCFVILNTEDGNIQAGLPLYEVKSSLTGNRVVSIPFASLCDPLISSGEDFDFLFEAALVHFKKFKPSFFEVRSLHSYPLMENVKLLDSGNFKSHSLDLGLTLEELYGNISANSIRKPLQRAIEGPLQVREAKNEIDLKEFYSLHTKLRKRIGRPVMPYLFFQCLWREFYPKKHLSLFLAEFEGRPAGAIMSFQFRDRVSGEFAGMDERYRQLTPNHLLIWETIKSAHKDGFKVFDFGRTSLSDKGIIEFKKRWGAKEVDLCSFYYPKSFAYKILDKENSFIFNLIQHICKNAPEIMLPYIGRFLYKHLG